MFSREDQQHVASGNCTGFCWCSLNWAHVQQQKLVDIYLKDRMWRAHGAICMAMSVMSEAVLADQKAHKFMVSPMTMRDPRLLPVMGSIDSRK